jgi:ketosteroid isomerase-like protein
MDIRRALRAFPILGAACVVLAPGAVVAADRAATAPTRPAAGAPTVQASATSPTDATVGEILRLEREIGAAIGRGDAATAGRIWSDDYQYVGSDGKAYTKAERLALTKPPAPDAPPTVGSVDDVRVRVFGDTAVALVWTTWRTSVDGRERVLKFVATHVWVRETGSWRLNTAQVGPASKT